MNHHFSNADFQFFVDYINEFVELFGLSEWEYEVKHEQLSDGVSATCTYSIPSKKACFQLTTVVKGDYCMETNIRRLALHEVLHLLIADFGWVCSEAKDGWSNITIAHEHILVNRLIRAFEKRQNNLDVFYKTDL